MAVDPDLLNEAKIAEADLIEAEHATDVARAEFHRAVRRLHLDGASLRELATALGLSHQRVHQIVRGVPGGRPGSRAGETSAKPHSWPGSFRAHRREVRTLIGGPSRRLHR